MDALSHNPCGPAPAEGISESEVQVANVSKSSCNEGGVDDISVLLELEPSNSDFNPETLTSEQ